MLFMLQKHCLYLSILIIMDYSLFPSWEYMLFEHGVYGYLYIIWYGIYLVVLHHVAFWFALEFGVMSRTYGSDRTGTALFIGHNDAASYLVGYEGRSSYASMCIHYWFGIEMQLRTLMGMKAGDHVHLYAFLYGFGGWMWGSILRYIMNNHVSHYAMAYRTLDILYVDCMDTWVLG